MVNPLGYRSTTVFDKADQPIAQVNPLGHASTMVYDVAGRPAATIDALGYRTTLIRDAADRVTAVMNPLGYRTTNVYDSASQTIATVDALGNRASSTYYADGQLRCTIDALGNRTTHAYDKAGNEIGVMNANGYISTGVYDAGNQRIAAQSPLGYRTTSVFDAAGRRIALVDANGGRNSFTFDAADRKTVEMDPLGRRTTISYDGANRQTAKLDARDVLVTFQYDAVNQPTGRVYTAEVPVTMQYDPVGNRTVVQDVTGTSTSTFDALNRVKAVLQPSGKTITYAYEATGHRRTLMEPGGGLFTYSHDSGGRIAHLVNPQGDRTTFSYDPANRRTLTQLANGTRASVTYDEASRLTQLYNLKSDNSIISGFTYNHDAFGNRIAVLEASGDRVTWTYDQANQLLNEQRSGANAYSAANTYDPLGNRLVKNLNGALITYAYDLANQLLTAREATGVTTYTFDVAGNQRVVLAPDGALTTNTWNADNRLIGVALPSAALVTNTYHADGLRDERQDSDATIRFLWDDQNYLAETDEHDETQAVYTNEPLLYGNLISQYRKTGELWLPSYYHFDAVGSTRDLTSDAQNLTDTYIYTPWGELLTSSGTTMNAFRFVGLLGYYRDTATDNYYIRARSYLASLTRWMSADPLPALRASPNLYAYVDLDPVNSVDASGEQATKSPFKPQVKDCTIVLMVGHHYPPDEELDELFQALKRLKSDNPDGLPSTFRVGGVGCLPKRLQDTIEASFPKNAIPGMWLGDPKTEGGGLLRNRDTWKALKIAYRAAVDAANDICSSSTCKRVEIVPLCTPDARVQSRFARVNC
jgi:RHS repeat-associated protein